MAAIVWYLTSSLGGTAHQAMSETDPGAEAFASPVYGWSTGTVVAARYARADAQNEVTSATFGTTVYPDGIIVTTAGAGDCFVSDTTYNGTFDTGTWTIDLNIRANGSAGGTSRGRVRVFSGPNQDGSSATERTSATMVGSTVTPSTSATTNSQCTGSVTGWTTSGAEYILIQVAWETVTAGGMATNDEDFRVGNASGAGTKVTSANFTATAATDTGWGSMEAGRRNQPVIRYG